MWPLRPCTSARWVIMYFTSGGGLHIISIVQGQSTAWGTAHSVARHDIAHRRASAGPNSAGHGQTIGQRRGYSLGTAQRSTAQHGVRAQGISPANSVPSFHLPIFILSHLCSKSQADTHASVLCLYFSFPPLKASLPYAACFC